MDKRNNGKFPRILKLSEMSKVQLKREKNIDKKMLMEKENMKPAGSEKSIKKYETSSYKLSSANLIHQDIRSSQALCIKKKSQLVLTSAQLDGPFVDSALCIDVRPPIDSNEDSSLFPLKTDASTTDSSGSNFKSCTRSLASTVDKDLVQNGLRHFNLESTLSSAKVIFVEDQADILIVDNLRSKLISPSFLAVKFIKDDDNTQIVDIRENIDGTMVSKIISCNPSSSNSIVSEERSLCECEPEWILNLRQDFKCGVLKEADPFQSKLIYYLKLPPPIKSPNIVPFRSIFERYELFKANEANKKEVGLDEKNLPSKRKRKIWNKDTSRILRSRQSSDHPKKLKLMDMDSKVSVSKQKCTNEDSGDAGLESDVNVSTKVNTSSQTLAVNMHGIQDNIVDLSDQEEEIVKEHAIQSGNFIPDSQHLNTVSLLQSKSPPTSKFVFRETGLQDKEETVLFNESSLLLEHHFEFNAESSKDLREHMINEQQPLRTSTSKVTSDNSSECQSNLSCYEDYVNPTEFVHMELKSTSSDNSSHQSWGVNYEEIDVQRNEHLAPSGSSQLCNSPDNPQVEESAPLTDGEDDSCDEESEVNNNGLIPQTPNNTSCTAFHYSQVGGPASLTDDEDDSCDEETEANDNGLFPQTPNSKSSAAFHCNQMEELTDGEDVTDDGHLPQTPKDRKYFLDKFGINTPSPLMKRTKFKEKDLKRFSLAVHHWADVNHGGIEFLRKTKLTDQHFRSILAFAGPNSEIKLIKGWSALQMKSMWRNLGKRSMPMYGNQETGFENVFGFHSPELPYCPFAHCTNPLIVKLKRNPAVLKSKELIVSPSKKNPARNLFAFDQGNSNKKGGYSTDSQSNNNIHSESQVTKEISMKNIFISDNPNGKKLLVCKREGCSESFTTAQALKNHYKNSKTCTGVDTIHSTVCPHCGKLVKYIGQHLATKHPEVGKLCVVCNKVQTESLKVHRSKCIQCPYCPYQNAQHRERLIAHIQNRKCKVAKSKKKSDSKVTVTNLLSTDNELVSGEKDQVSSLVSDQSGQALSSKISNEEIPSVQQVVTENSKSNADTTIESIENGNIDFGLRNVSITAGSENVESNTVAESSNNKTSESRLNICPTTDSSLNEIRQQFSDEINSTVSTVKEVSSRNSRCKRKCHPFDDVMNNAYESEYEEDDTDDYTDQRRRLKDELELLLRKEDSVEHDSSSDEIITKFKKFLKVKKDDIPEGPFSEVKEVATISRYTNLVEKYLLPAFKAHVDPFETNFLLDCSTPKKCKISGQQRECDDKEPIYMSPRVIDIMLANFESNLRSFGNIIAQILAATVEFMEFLELEFQANTDIFGYKPLKKLKFHHSIVQTYISGKGLWHRCNKGKKNALEENEIIKEYTNPNEDIQFLERYEEYKDCSQRKESISEIINYACDENLMPTDADYCRMANVVMTEIVCSSGCRPVVPLKMTIGSYADKRTGFNPFLVTPDDCKVEEQNGNVRILTRINPNLPPKHKACKHQIAEKSATCSQNCSDACQPDGYNLLVSWNKNNGKKGSHYLHLTRPLKAIIDLFLIIRRRKFKGRKLEDPTNDSMTDDWLNDDQTPIFLNTACKTFQQVNLKHVSEFMKMNAHAMKFRVIVSTWAQTHGSEEIRRAEEETLDHSVLVAKDRYLANKQLKPQILISTYNKEEEIYSKALEECINNGALACQDKVQNSDDEMKKKRYEGLVQDRLKHKSILDENQRLGPKRRVYGQDREAVRKLLVEAGFDLNEMMKMKPLEFRHHLIRLVCSPGVVGDSLRNLWIKIYAGDYVWGVRDQRRKVEEKGWSKAARRDRNTWIAYAIRNAFIAWNRNVNIEKSKVLEDKGM